MKSINGLIGRVAAVFEKRSAEIFLVVALVFGGIFVFTLPPLFGNDEIVHFPRAYQIQTGNLWEDKLSGYDYGGQVPVQIKQFNDDFRELVQSQTLDKTRLHELIAQYSREKLTNPETTSLAFSSAGVYSPWSYLPSAVGVWIAHILNLPLIWYVWLGRLMTLLVWIGLTYWALRLLPAGKLFMVAIALLPTSLVQAATIGMDGVVNGLAWVIIAMTFAVMSGKVKLHMPQALLLAGLCFFLATTKQGYLPIALLPLIIPARFYVWDRRTSTIVRISFGVALIVAAVGYVAKTMPLASLLHFVQRPGVYVDSHAQVRHILTHPLQVLFIILVQPFTTFAGGVWAGTVGVITNKMIYLPALVIATLYACLLLAFAAGGRAYHFAGQYYRRLGAASLSVGLITFVLINLALYVSFTSVAHPHIEGLQGRYFLPLAPLAIGALALLKGRQIIAVPRIAHLVVGAGILIGLVTSLAGISGLL